MINLKLFKSEPYSQCPPRCPYPFVYISEKAYYKRRTNKSLKNWLKLVIFLVFSCSLIVMPRDKIISKRKRSSSRKRRRTIQKFTFFNEPVIETNLNKPKYTQRGIKYPIISRIYDAKRFRISKVLKVNSNASQKNIKSPFQAFTQVPLMIEMSTAFISFWNALGLTLI